MKAVANIPKVALLLLFCLMSFGCGEVDRHYDLSKVPPFSAYTGRDLVLTQDVLLVAYHTSRAEPPASPDIGSTRFRLFYNKDPEAQYAGSADYLTTLLLRAGTQVHLEGPTFWSFKPGCMQTLRPMQWLDYEVVIKLSEPGWPNQVDTFFRHAVDIEQGKLTIAPAPWEPLDTAPLRLVPWPDDKYLVRDAN